MRNVVLGLVALVSVSVSAAVSAEGIQHFDVALTALHTDTALVLPSQAVDERALWSPDSRYLAVNVEGEWLKVDLEGGILAAGAWRGGQTLAVITNREAVSPATSDDIAAWQKRTGSSPAKLPLAMLRCSFSNAGFRPLSWSLDQEGELRLVGRPGWRTVIAS